MSCRSDQQPAQHQHTALSVTIHRHPAASLTWVRIRRPCVLLPGLTGFCAALLRLQDDLLNPNLTVRETLYYTAALRLPRTFDAAEREVRVKEVIREMGLSHCENVIVGDPSKKGISGGERRRVCIGMELITRPTLLFLDEPTSGLDSVTAFTLMELL